MKKALDFVRRGRGCAGNNCCAGQCLYVRLRARKNGIAIPAPASALESAE